MKSFREFLAEVTFADLRPKPGQWRQVPTSVIKHAQTQDPVNIDTELFRLLDKTYHYIGGHIDFKKPSDLPADHTIWYAVDVDGNAVPDALQFGKSTTHGIKWTGGATDGTPAAKAEYYQRFVTQLRTPGNYAEMSEAMMHIMITRYNIPCEDNHKQVERILGKPVKWIGAHPDGKYPGYRGFYTRTLGGSQHMKILLGHPKT